MQKEGSWDSAQSKSKWRYHEPNRDKQIIWKWRKAENGNRFYLLGNMIITWLYHWRPCAKGHLCLFKALDWFIGPLKSSHPIVSLWNLIKNAANGISNISEVPWTETQWLCSFGLSWGYWIAWNVLNENDYYAIAPLPPQRPCDSFLCPSKYIKQWILLILISEIWHVWGMCGIHTFLFCLLAFQRLFDFDIGNWGSLCCYHYVLPTQPMTPGLPNMLL